MKTKSMLFRVISFPFRLAVVVLMFLIVTPVMLIMILEDWINSLFEGSPDE